LLLTSEQFDCNWQTYNLWYHTIETKQLSSKSSNTQTGWWQTYGTR